MAKKKAPNHPPPSYDRLRSLLRYDRRTGHFFWLPRTNGHPRDNVFNAKRSGKRAGGRWHKGYRKISIDGVPYFEHRLALFYVRREWPDEVDHIDGDVSNNRISNLRAAVRVENCRNRSKCYNNTSGYKGVYTAPSLKNPWRAAIGLGGRLIHLGCFPTPEIARDVYNRAARKYFGDFFRNDGAAA